jgi:hypothetical protein
MLKLKLQDELSNLKKLQSKLQTKKEKSGLTAEEQTSLEETAGRIFDIEEELEVIAKTEADEAAAKTETNNDGYVPAEDEKHLVHCHVIHGKRFDSETGKEVSIPFIQKYSVQEFSAIERSAPTLGYAITVLYTPSK